MIPQPSEPRTAAGQAMESWLREPEDYEWGRKVTTAIIAIEAEAAAADPVAGTARVATEAESAFLDERQPDGSIRRVWLRAPDPVASPPEAQHGVAIPPGWGGLQAIVDNAHGQGRKVHVGFEETCEQNVAVASPAPLDVERLARALQSTILTSIDEYMGPGGGAYRAFWEEMTDPQKRHVMQDAAALAAEYARLTGSPDPKDDPPDEHEHDPDKCDECNEIVMEALRD